MLKSRRFNNRVLHLLLICGGVFCAVQGISQTTQSAQDVEDEKAFKGIVEVNGRLQILPLTQPLKVGEANDVPIQLHGFKVHSVYATWGYYKGESGSWVTDDGKEVTVLHHPDGSTYVQIEPMKIGRLRLQLGVWFEDGGDEDESIDAEVVFPDRKPEKIFTCRPESGDLKVSGTIYMDMTGMENKRGLCTMALYKDTVYPTPIPLKYLSFRLITDSENDPPISFDESTGIITALHIGHALIQTTFQDMSTLTCVDVLKVVTDGSDRTVCRELVPEGMAVPLTGFEETDKGFSDWMKARPRKPSQQ
jgi:hypothetical protein